MAMDLNALLARVGSKRAELQARSGKNNAEKPPAGKSRWRILPGWRKGEPTVFYHDFAQHWIKDGDGKVQAVIVCEHETFGRECVPCGTIASASAALKGDKALETLKEMRGKRVVLVNALRVDGGDANATQPKLLSMPVSCFETYLSLLQTRAGDEINLLDADTGRDVLIERSGTGLTTEYNLTDAAKSTKVDPEALNNLVNIDAWIEAERQKGLSKMSAIAPAVRAVLASVGVSHGTTMIPAAASLVATRVARPAPVIEHDEPAVTVAVAPSVGEKLGLGSLAGAATAAAPAAPAPAVKPVDSSELDDAEIEALLASLK